VDLSDAVRVHAALAHKLLDVWRLCPRAQQLVQNELETWSLRAHNSVPDYLGLMADRLRSGGAEPLVLDVIADVAEEYQQVDEMLTQMFERALELTRECYEQHADWKVSDVKFRWVPATNPIYPDSVVTFGDLGAAACVPPRQEAIGPATVKLIFVPSLLGPPSWASVPYLLCHELVCHVNQAAPMSSEDPLAEGWMDMVALQLHNRWANKIFPGEARLAVNAANRLSDGVLKLWRGLPEPHLTTRVMRTRGNDAAQWVEGKLQPFDDPRQDLPGLIRLSLQLNRVSPTVADRLEFVSKVNNCRRDLGLQARLLASLRRWRDDLGSASDVLSFS
jgi:hypothetical protein